MIDVEKIKVIEGMNVFDVDVEEMIDVLFEEYRNGIVDEKEFVESFEVYLVLLWYMLW